MLNSAVIVLLDLVALALFMAFVGAALCWRKHAATRNRLMLLASIAIIGPATTRLAFWTTAASGPLGAALVAALE